MKIVFHGANAATFHSGFETKLERKYQLFTVSDLVIEAGEAQLFSAADVIIGTKLSEAHPVPENARLYQVAGAGFDAVDFSRLPGNCPVCNCFGHEQAIAEYVMAAILQKYIPLAEADSALRKGRWPFMAGRADGLRIDCSGRNFGIVGYGHIGRALAQRAELFGMVVHVANRSRVGEDEPVDYYYSLEELDSFWSRSDVVVIALPLTGETTGLVGEAAFASMRSDSLFINVGRGPVVDEKALYEALKAKMIGGAVIDTWYTYPEDDNDIVHPSRYPFHELDNLIATPHMSGWSRGTIDRRQQVMAENIRRLADGEELLNIVRGT